MSRQAATDWICCALESKNDEIATKKGILLFDTAFTTLDISNDISLCL